MRSRGTLCKEHQKHLVAVLAPCAGVAVRPRAKLLISVLLRM